MDLKTILLIASVIIAILAVKTLLPNAGASKRNLLGFRSTCTFSPVSTLILLWIAAMICVIRARLMNSIGTNWAYGLSIALSALFLCAVLYYSYLYAKLKSGKNRNGQS